MREKKYFLYFGIFLMVFLIVNLVFKAYKKSEREQFGVVSIAKMGDFKGTKGGKNIKFVYVVNGKVFHGESSVSSLPHVSKGDFYKIVYSSKNPKNVEVLFNEKITDSVLIHEAALDFERQIRDLYR